MIKKYKMWILVVFGIMIMISFLMADWLQRGISFANDNRRVFTLDGSKVTQSEYQQAAAKVEGLKRATGRYFDRFGGEMDAAQWRLLSESVQRAGLYGGPGDGHDLAVTIVTQRLAREYGTEARRFTDWQDNAIADMKITREMLDERIEQLAGTMIAGIMHDARQSGSGAEAFAELRGYNRLEDAYGSIPHLSEARLATKVREAFDSARIQYVWLPVTDALAGAVPAPTAEELTAHFNKYKDIEVGAGEYGMGLKQPDRVSYSYFFLPRSAIEGLVHVDPIDVRKRLMRDYPGKESDPANREAVEARLKGEQVDRIRNALESAVKAEILRVTTGIPEKDGYKVLPTDPKEQAKVADLLGVVAKAVNRINNEMKVAFSAVAVTGPTKLQSQSDVAKEPGAGDAAAQHGRGTLPIEALLFESKEFGKPAGAIPVQAGVPIIEPFHAPAHSPPKPEDGATFFFMLNEVKAAASPASLDEVRAKVEADVRKIKAIDAARKLASERTAVAIELGLGQVADQLKTSGFPEAAVKTAMLSRQGSDSADETIAAADFRKEVMTKAATIDPALKIEKASAPERTWVTTIPGKLGAVLVQITEYKPVTAEEFQAAAAMFKNRIEIDELVESDPRFTAFKQESLVKRFHVEGLKTKDESK